MILPDKFTPKEIEKEILADCDEINEKYLAYLTHNRNKTARIIRDFDDSKFPLDSTTKVYKSKNNNTWFCYQTIVNKRTFMKEPCYAITKFCIAETPWGKYVYVPVEKVDKKLGIHVKHQKPKLISRFLFRIISNVTKSVTTLITRSSHYQKLSNISLNITLLVYVQNTLRK